MNARKTIRLGSLEVPISAAAIALLLLILIGGGVVGLLWSWRKEKFNRTPHLIDLSHYYNDSLDTGWQHQLMRGNNLGTLPRGRQVFAGVEFDVRGIIQLTSPQLRRYHTATNFPEQVQGIPIGRKCQRLHFLHATGWTVPDGTRIGSYIIRYADASEEAIPILFGRETGNWWALPSEMARPSRAVVWQGTNAANQAIHLFRQTWSNPHPESEVQSLDFVSRLTRSAPFLIAITAEP